MSKYCVEYVEPLDSIQDGKYLDQLGNCQILSKEHT
jgi:hypothetical protein